MVSLKGIDLQKKDGTSISSDSALTGVSKVALYFSAHWCPPCRKFTPALKDFYDEVNEDNKAIEVIFVSADKSEEELNDYHNEMGDWLRVPYTSEELREQLRDYYGKKACPKTGDLIRSGIPCLVVVDHEKEEVVSYDGVNDVTALGSMALDMKWSGM